MVDLTKTFKLTNILNDQRIFDERRRNLDRISSDYLINQRNSAQTTYGLLKIIETSIYQNAWNKFSNGKSDELTSIEKEVLSKYCGGVPK